MIIKKLLYMGKEFVVPSAGETQDHPSPHFGNANKGLPQFTRVSPLTSVTLSRGRMWNYASVGDRRCRLRIPEF